MDISDNAYYIRALTADECHRSPLWNRRGCASDNRWAGGRGFVAKVRKQLKMLSWVKPSSSTNGH